MKTNKSTFLVTVILFGLQLLLTGCIAEVGGGGHYGGGPWYHDGPWMDGGRRGGGPGPRGHVEVDIHPPGLRR